MSSSKNRNRVKKKNNNNKQNQEVQTEPSYITTIKAEWCEFIGELFVDVVEFLIKLKTRH